MDSTKQSYEPPKVKTPSEPRKDPSKPRQDPSKPKQDPLRRATPGLTAAVDTIRGTVEKQVDAGAPRKVFEDVLSGRRPLDHALADLVSGADKLLDRALAEEKKVIQKADKKGRDRDQWIRRVQHENAQKLGEGLREALAQAKQALAEEKATAEQAAAAPPDDPLGFAKTKPMKVQRKPLELADTKAAADKPKREGPSIH